MHGPTCIVWANLTPFSLKMSDDLTDVLQRAKRARDVLEQ
jgi:hypothetical protein